MVPTLSDRYQILGPLGRGGTACVHMAHDRARGHRVAIKVLDARFACMRDVVDRFVREAAISQAVAHPGLVAIDRAETTADGAPCLVMEVIDGAPLGTLLEAGPLALDDLAAIGAQLAEVLAALHAAGYAHCDVKPDNVMVSRDADGAPRITLLDLGIARALDGGYREDCVSGTPAYLAPEQCRGLADDRSDVYALGCVLYALVTGRPPFEGPLTEVFEAHRSRLPVPPSRTRALPPVLERLILRMLSKDPTMRPRCAHVARALSAFGSPRPARNAGRGYTEDAREDARVRPARGAAASCAA